MRLVQYDNPDAVLLRNGKNYAYDTGIHFIGEKKICESTISLMENDMLVLMTDGITNAGIGKLSPGGWKREEVIEFLERWYTPDISPQNLAARLVEAGNVLCMDSNDDDMTALVFKVRPCRPQGRRARAEAFLCKRGQPHMLRRLHGAHDKPLP